MWLKLVVLFACAVFLVAADSPRKLYQTYRDNGDGEMVATPLADPYDGISYRLPNDTIPLTYNVWLSTDIHRGEFAFDGQVMIRFEVVQPTTEVTIQFRMMTIQHINLFNANNVMIEQNVNWFQNHAVEFLVIRPNTPLVVGLQYSVHVTYNATIRDNGLGIYRASYVNPQGETVWLASTQFQANEARHAFPWYFNF